MFYSPTSRQLMLIQVRPTMCAFCLKMRQMCLPIRAKKCCSSSLTQFWAMFRLSETRSVKLRRLVSAVSGHKRRKTRLMLIWTAIVHRKILQPGGINSSKRNKNFSTRLTLLVRLQCVVELVLVSNKSWLRHLVSPMSWLRRTRALGSSSLRLGGSATSLHLPKCWTKAAKSLHIQIRRKRAQAPPIINDWILLLL